MSKGSDGKGALRGLAVQKGKPLLAVGDRGTILRSSDDGTTWEAVPSATPENLTDVIWNDGLAVAVGHKGVALVSGDDGKTWKKVSTGSEVVLHRAAVAGSSLLAVGDKGTVLKIELANLK